MKTIRKSQERGHVNFGWLDSYHSFSFGEYYDPAHMGFRKLRVINEDWISPGQGFPTHPHQNMEIITYVISGSLEHKDSMGNSSVIKPGEVQRMSAGTGVRHSEYNHSKQEPVHLLQIWILPGETGIDPGYEQTFFPEESRRNQLMRVGSPNGQDGSVVIHQDVHLFASTLEKGFKLEHTIPAGRHVWLQLIKGRLKIDEHLLEAGDGLAVSDEASLSILAEAESEFLLFDLP